MSDDKKVLFVDFKKEKRRRKRLDSIGDKSLTERMANWVVLVFLMGMLFMVSLVSLFALAALIAGGTP